MSSPTAQPWWRLLNRNHWFVFTVASLAWLFDCFDQQIFTLARDPAMADLLLDKAKATEYGPYTTSFFLIGWAVGGLILGSLGDRFGRAKMLTYAILLYSVCTGLSALSTGFVDFCVYRFLTGLGVGGVFGLAVALVADSVPDRSRAPALGLLQSLSTWGNLLGALIGMSVGALAVHQLLPFHLRPWQVLFLIGSIPALFSVLVLRKLKEPQKWIDAKAAGAVTGVRFGSYAALLGDPRWRKNAWLGLIMCSAGIVGLWGIGNFHPKIVGSVVEAHLASAGLSPSAMASEKTFWTSVGALCSNIGGFCGMMSLAKLAQVKGRKFASIVALLCSLVTTWLVFWGLRDFSQIFWMMPLMGFGQLSVFGVYAVYLPELFPTSLRSTGTSFCYNFGRLVAATAPFTMGQITKRLGGDVEGFRTAGLWVSLVLLVGLVAIPFLPETKDRPLPEE
jgi:MFS family permease